MLLSFTIIVMRANLRAENSKAAELVPVAIDIQVESRLILHFPYGSAIDQPVEELCKGLGSICTKGIKSPAELREMIYPRILSLCERGRSGVQKLIHRILQRKRAYGHGLEVHVLRQ